MVKTGYQGRTIGTQYMRQDRWVQLSRRECLGGQQIYVYEKSPVFHRQDPGISEKSSDALKTPNYVNEK